MDVLALAAVLLPATYVLHRAGTAARAATRRELGRFPLHALRLGEVAALRQREAQDTVTLVPVGLIATARWAWWHS